MSRMKYEQIARRLLPCPYCHADIGDWCRTSGGNVAWYMHALRVEPVLEGWRYGYRQGTKDAKASRLVRIEDA